MTYWVENCEQVLISSMDSTGSMDQSSWRCSKIERLVGVSLTCNQLCFFLLLRREVEKKHLIQFIFLHEPQTTPFNINKRPGDWPVKIRTQIEQGPKKVCYQIILYLQGNSYVQSLFLWTTSTSLFLWWNNTCIRWSFISILFLALQ